MIFKIGLILLSGFLHALWNLLAKKSQHKASFLFAFQCISVVIFLPWVLWDLPYIQFGTLNTYLLLGSSMALHGLYFLFLAKLYTKADLSLAYPIIRGTGPLLIPLIGVLILGEHISKIGWMGIATIVTGILLLADLKKLEHHLDKVGLALLVGTCISSYIVVDKTALHYAPVMVVNWLSAIGNMIALGPFILHDTHFIQEWKTNWRSICVVAILAPGSYMLFLWVLQSGMVAQFAPMREMGTVFGTVLGVFLLKESGRRERLFASVLITIGVMVLGIFG